MERLQPITIGTCDWSANETFALQSMKDYL